MTSPPDDLESEPHSDDDARSPEDGDESPRESGRPPSHNSDELAKEFADLSEEAERVAAEAAQRSEEAARLLDDLRQPKSRPDEQISGDADRSDAANPIGEESAPLPAEATAPDVFPQDPSDELQAILEAAESVDLESLPEELVAELREFAEYWVDELEGGGEEHRARVLIARSWLEPEPIPEELYSEYSGEPFAKCLVCDAALTDDKIYQIQKSFRGTNVAFEMAICQGCGQSTSEEFSEESLEVMHAFLSTIVDAVAERSEACGACGKAQTELKNFSVVGLCKGESLLVPRMVVCMECEEDVQNRLSRETRERQGDFVRDNFPGVPADLDLAPLQF